MIDPLGGINSLWPLFGIGNQILAAMALILGTVILFKMKKQKYVWVTILPTIFLFITSMTAGWQKSSMKIQKLVSWRKPTVFRMPLHAMKF